jgi:hypothetical protein
VAERREREGVTIDPVTAASFRKLAADYAVNSPI